MDFDNENEGFQRRENSFRAITGVIAEITGMDRVGEAWQGSVLLVTLEETGMDTVNFVVAPDTYVVDFETLAVGMTCTFWYATEEPVPLILPPRYHAVAAARESEDRRIDVSFYDGILTNAENTLRLNMDPSVAVRTVNHQNFSGSPANHNLIVSYGISTRSIPAMTTPKEIVVLAR